MTSSMSSASRSRRKAAYSPAFAAMMLRYSIHAYYDPPGEENATESGWGPIAGTVHVP